MEHRPGRASHRGEQRRTGATRHRTGLGHRLAEVARDHAVAEDPTAHARQLADPATVNPDSRPDRY